MEEKEKLHEIPVAIQDTVAEDLIVKQTKRFSIFQEGRVYKTLYTKKFAERVPYKAPNPLLVLSHIPGSVVEICVKPKQKVKKGDKLMIYEAMKMKNIVTAPFDGIIKEVNAKLGEHLPKGALLVTFKKPDKK